MNPNRLNKINILSGRPCIMCTTMRPCVNFRKITNGFRTEWVPAFMPTSIRHRTARRCAITTLEAIRLTLAGKPLATAP